MNNLPQILQAFVAFNRSVEAQAHKARTDLKFASELRRRWRKIRQSIPIVDTHTGLRLPRLALPQTDDPAQIAMFLFGEGLPGEFPFINAAYREMYLAPLTPRLQYASGTGHVPVATEEPTRLFAGFGLADDTNKRFHYLTRQQRTLRLSTAFDGPTLYGLDSDADGAFGKIGE